MEITNEQLFSCFKNSVDGKDIDLTLDNNKVLLTLNGQKYLVIKDVDRLDCVAFIDAMTDSLMRFASGIRVGLLLKNPILYRAIRKNLFNRTLDGYTEALKLVSESEGRTAMFEFIA